MAEIVTLGPSNRLKVAARHFEAGKFAAAYEMLLPLAEDGSGNAQCLLGMILAEPRDGVPQDLVAAVKWLDVGIRDQNSIQAEDARDTYSKLLDSLDWQIIGLGRHAAFQWQQAHINAENGDPNGAPSNHIAGLATWDARTSNIRGTELNQGNGMPVDYEKAFRCFKHAAELGDACAAYNVGLSYYTGKGVVADPALALHWLQLGADRGFARAALMLGVMTVRGHGVKQDINAALRHLKRAADLGDEDAPLMAAAIKQGNLPY